jgi:hypothetical protein
VEERIHLPIAVAALVAALTAGCSAGSGGELSNGSFAYVCTTSTDVHCQDSIFPSNLLPNAVAVGGQFNITYTGETPKTEDGVEFQVRVVPVSPTMVESVGGSGFRVVSPGEAAFLGRGANGVVADFIHVHAAVVDRIGMVSSGQDVTSVEVDTTFDVSVTANPLDENGQTLGGGLDYSWTSTDDAVASVSSSGLDNHATITGKTAGTAVISVTSGDAAATVAVTVGGTQ